MNEEIAPQQEFRAVGAGAEMVAQAKHLWWLLVLMGLVSVFVGILLLAWPGQTLLVLTVVLGIYLLVFGAIRFIESVFDRTMEQRGLNAILGILGVVLGLFVMREPVRFVWVAALVVGLFWVVRGLVEIFRSLGRSGGSDRGWRFVAGLVSVIAGAVVLLWPDVSVLVLAVVSGIYLIVVGVIEIVVAFKARRA